MTAREALRDLLKSVNMPDSLAEGMVEKILAMAAEEHREQVRDVARWKRARYLSPASIRTYRAVANRAADNIK